MRLMVASVIVLCGTLGVADEVRILPDAIVLDVPGQTHSVLVQVFQGDAATANLPAADLRVEDPSVAVVEQRKLVARSAGTTTIRAVVGGKEVASATVTVHGGAIRTSWSFRNHVEPVLTRLGCNSGACHGALAGKGGFRLSLRGYDPDQDFFNITQQHLGRRIDLHDPGMSLILTKPTTAVPHKGGQRMTTDSKNYKVLSEWISAGSPGPEASDVRLDHLEVLPQQILAAHNQQQPLLVRAHYADGHIEDVTQWARFTSASEAVARVDEHGVASVVGPGEGAIAAAFGSEIVIARITVPFQQDVPDNVYASARRDNFIDDLVLAQLQQLRLEPSPRASDATFLRRAFLDTIGVLPTAQEVRDFLEDDDPEKRNRIIDELFQRPEFVDFWTYQWSDVLMINGNLLRQEPVKAYYEWVRSHVEKNTPWNEVVRELVTSKGSSLSSGATNFFALHQKPEDMAENVSQAFLGLSIGCARCHNHPLEKWTNDQYYAFANLFSRVRAKGWGGDGRSGNGERTLVTVSNGELVQPRTGKPQPPTPLDGTPVRFNDDRDRREHLADWLVSDSNVIFSRSIANRVWRNFMHVGLVEQVDDMRASNPPSNEPLLAALAAYLVEQKFDLQVLMRQILQSETYQRSSTTLPTNRGDTRYYSRAYPLRLMAEVMLDAVSQVTDVSTTFTEISFPGGDVQKTEYYTKGTRALQLYDSAVDSYFLKTFGRNQRRITCECERSNDPSMVQVLHLSNGNTLNEKLSAEDNRITHWQKEFADDYAGLVEEMFLTTLSRYPQPREQAELTQMLAETSSENQRVLLEDMLWSLLSSREFLFTH